jgi:hypothetical protein
VNAVHVALAKQIPHGHLEGSGVAAGDNGHLVARWQLQRFLTPRN